MYAKHTALLITVIVGGAFGIYPYFDTQDFIYNVPKVYRISITLDKLLKHYEKKPSKDPEWYIALGIARGQLEYTINELDKSVPAKLKENLQNITRVMDRIRNSTDYASLIYRSKDYEYVAKAILENIDVLAAMMEPISIGTMGTQKPYRFSFEQYVQEARTKMPKRKAAGRVVGTGLTAATPSLPVGVVKATKGFLPFGGPAAASFVIANPLSKGGDYDACTMELLVTALDTQTTKSEGACELTPECNAQIIKGSGLAFQQTSRLRAASLGHLFDCLEGLDISAHIYKICIQIYKETRSLEAWDHPPGTRTLFMQQILYCALQGYGEFIKPRWMNKILAWQEPRGCYSDDRQPFLKLTGYIGPGIPSDQKNREEEYRVKKAATSEGGSCNSLTSAMALGSLVIYIRALLETDQAFQYDVLA